MTAKIPPRTEELLAHLEVSRGAQRTDLVHEAVVALLRSYGYQPEAA